MFKQTFKSEVHCNAILLCINKDCINNSSGFFCISSSPREIAVRLYPNSNIQVILLLKLNVALLLERLHFPQPALLNTEKVLSCLELNMVAVHKVIHTL